MYIQDEKQKILANMDIPGEWNETYQTSRMWTIMVVLPQIGAFVTYEGKSYVILTVTTYQEETGISTLCRILRIDDEGEDMGEMPITVHSADLTLI